MRSIFRPKNPIDAEAIDILMSRVFPNNIDYGQKEEFFGKNSIAQRSLPSNVSIDVLLKEVRMRFAWWKIFSHIRNSDSDYIKKIIVEAKAKLVKVQIDSYTAISDDQIVAADKELMLVAREVAKMRYKTKGLKHWNERELFLTALEKSLENPENDELFEKAQSYWLRGGIGSFWIQKDNTFVEELTSKINPATCPKKYLPLLLDFLDPENTKAILRREDMDEKDRRLVLEAIFRSHNEDFTNKVTQLGFPILQHKESYVAQLCLQKVQGLLLNSNHSCRLYALMLVHADKSTFFRTLEQIKGKPDMLFKIIRFHVYWGQFMNKESSKVLYRIFEKHTYPKTDFLEIYLLDRLDENMRKWLKEPAQDANFWATIYFPALIATGCWGVLDIILQHDATLLGKLDTSAIQNLVQLSSTQSQKSTGDKDVKACIETVGALASSYLDHRKQEEQYAQALGVSHNTIQRILGQNASNNPSLGAGYKRDVFRVLRKGNQ
jgi:hypothetical protein